ncbi:hypothetical protein LDC_2855, partial [sediment metagenome]
MDKTATDVYIWYMSNMRVKAALLKAVKSKTLRSPNVNRFSMKLDASSGSMEGLVRLEAYRSESELESVRLARTVSKQRAKGHFYTLRYHPHPSDGLEDEFWGTSMANRALARGKMIGLEVDRHVHVVAKVQKLLRQGVEVNIATARSQMPEMVKRSAAGEFFLIRNARTQLGPSAVLIGAEELGKMVKKASDTAIERTMGDIRKSLPFTGFKVEPLTAKALPGPGLPPAILPE